MAKKKTGAATRNWPLLRTYAQLVEKGAMTIEQVPAAYRQDVRDIIDGKLVPPSE